MDFRQLQASLRRYEALDPPTDFTVIRTRRELRNRKAVSYYRSEGYPPELFPENLTCEYPGCREQLLLCPETYHAVVHNSFDSTGQRKVVGVDDYGLCRRGHINHVFDDEDLEQLLQRRKISSEQIEARTLPEYMPEEYDAVTARSRAIGTLTIHVLQEL